MARVHRAEMKRRPSHELSGLARCAGGLRDGIPSRSPFISAKPRGRMLNRQPARDGSGSCSDLKAGDFS